MVYFLGGGEMGIGKSFLSTSTPPPTPSPEIHYETGQEKKVRNVLMQDLTPALPRQRRTLRGLGTARTLVRGRASGLQTTAQIASLAGRKTPTNFVKRAGSFGSALFVYFFW